MLSHKKKITILLLLTIILLFLIFGNIWIFIHRADGFMFMPASYVTLYNIKEIPRISKFNIIDRDTLQVKLSYVRWCSEWKITPDEGSPYKSFGFYPKVKLLKHRHTYQIDCLKHENFPPIFLKINFVPLDYFPAADFKTSNHYQIEDANIPIGKIKQYSINQWRSNYYQHEEVEEALRIIQEEAKIQTYDPTLLKIEKLVQYLLVELDNKRGTPTAEMSSNSLSPLQIYKKALNLSDNYEAGIWCTQFAKIYTFFANVADIPTRCVEVVDFDKKVWLSGHVFSESFIKEQNKWAFVDLMSKKLYVYNQKNREVLNTLDLFHVGQISVYNDLTAKVFESGKIIELPYSSVSDSENRFFKEGVMFIFPFPYKNRDSFTSRFYRYILHPDLFYSSAVIESKHYIKLVFFVGGIIVFTIWLIFCISFKRLYVLRKS